MTESGHYVYVEAQWEDAPATATLYLPVKEPHCLRFWYYIFGVKTPFLIAATQAFDMNEIVFQRNGSQGDFWHPAAVDLQLKNQNYNVSLREILKAI